MRIKMLEHGCLGRGPHVHRVRRCVVGALALLISFYAAGIPMAGEPATRVELPLDRGVGQKLSNFTLKDAVSGRPIMLYGYAGKKAAVLVFMGTECPLANLYAPRLVELDRKYRGKGVIFLGINANARESGPAIADQARKHGIEFPMLRDERNVVADLALVERTPEVLVLDGAARLRYRGAIDDQYGVGTRKPKPGHRYVADALDAILEGKPVPLAATAVPGCLIDRVEPTKITNGQPRIRAAAPEIQAAHRDADRDPAIDVGPVSYASNTAKIIQEKCQSCHRPGQIAPFPLVDFDDARKHAAMIHEVVENRRMPPWHADPRFSQFANDRSLSARDRALLMAWVEQGTPLGDPRKIPTPQALPEGWTIGNPDAVFQIPETYVVPAQGVVDYVRFRVPSGFTEDRWIQAAEAQPGDRSVVHHIIVYVDPRKGGKPRPETLSHLVGYAPGDMPSVYPPGTAKKIPAGADLVFELHYTPTGRIRTDRSRVGLVFAKESVKREAHTVGIAEGGFMIPPGQDNVAVASSLTLGQDVRLLSFMPHMHLRGKDFRYTITRPGKPTETVLSVPAYDFGWQSYYILARPLDLPRGTRIDCLAHYDNSDKNPNNPDPRKAVRWGDQTFDEMMIGYIDIDIPRGGRLQAEPEEDEHAENQHPAVGVLRTVGALLGVRLGGDNPGQPPQSR